MSLKPIYSSRTDTKHISSILNTMHILPIYIYIYIYIYNIYIYLYLFSNAYIPSYIYTQHFGRSERYSAKTNSTFLNIVFDFYELIYLQKMG